MRIDEIVEDELAKRRFRKKVHGVADSLPGEFAKQDELEKAAVQAIEDINSSSERWNSKFKSPALMTEFSDNVSPLEAIIYSLPSVNDLHRPMDRLEKFAVTQVKQHSKEMLEILRDDLNKLKVAWQHFKKQDSAAIQYVVAPFNRKVSEVESLIQTVESTLQKI